MFNSIQHDIPSTKIDTTQDIFDTCFDTSTQKIEYTFEKGLNNPDTSLKDQPSISELGPNKNRFNNLKKQQEPNQLQSHNMESSFGQLLDGLKDSHFSDNNYNNYQDKDEYLLKENIELKEYNNDLNSKISKKQTKIEDLKNENRQLRKREVELNERNFILYQDMMELQKQINKNSFSILGNNESLLDETQKKSWEDQEQIAELKSIKIELEKKNDELQANFHKKNLDLKDRNSKLEAILSQKDKLVESKTDQIELLKNSIERLYNEKNILGKNAQQETNKLQELEKAVINKNEIIEQLKSTISYLELAQPKIKTEATPDIGVNTNNDWDFFCLQHNLSEANEKLVLSDNQCRYL